MDHGEYLIALGKKIREIRRGKGIPIQIAAAMANTHKSCLSDIENGKMNVKIIQLKKLADLFEVDVKDFL